MPRIRIPVPYSGIDPSILVTTYKREGEEFLIEGDLYKDLYAVTPTFVRLPSHIRIGPGATSVLVGNNTTEATKASDCSCTLAAAVH